MQTYFQHPDTGVSCDATYDPSHKILVVRDENGEEVLRKSVHTASDATRELIRFGVDADEARFDVQLST